MYDIYKVDEVEQKFCLTDLLAESNREKYGDFNSFCFSPASFGWEQFSVYFNSSNGEIFRICPIVPVDMLVSQINLLHYENPRSLLIKIIRTILQASVNIMYLQAQQNDDIEEEDW